MPTFNNYTFSNVTYTITEGDSIPAETGGTAVITISPVNGYALNVADFSLAPSFSNSYVDSVVFAQDGGNVTATVTFTAGTVMPSANVTIPLCIVGAGEVELITIAGKYSSVIGSNITPISETDVVYSNSGSLGQSELLFSKTYTADSGYYFDSPPTAQILIGNQSNYNIVQTPTYNIDGQLTALQFDVNYVYPNNNVSGDEIKFTATAKQIYVAPQLVTGYSRVLPRVYATGETKVIRFFGDEGAVFSVVLTDDHSNSWNVVTNVEIPASGYLDVSIEFPDITDETYTSSIYEATISGDLASPFNQPNPIVFTQVNIAPKITFAGSSTEGITGFTNVEIEGAAYSRPTKETLEIDWDLTVPDGSILATGDLNISAFSNAVVIEELTASASVSNSSTFTVDSITSTQIGDKFTLGESDGLAPFQFEITNIAGTTITVSPNITINEDQTVNTFRNNGNVFEIDSYTFTQVSNTEINAKISLLITAFGDSDVTFTLDLDEVIERTEEITCASTAQSGGEGVTDLAIPLDPAGGHIIFLVNPYGQPDKFEILHGTGAGTKVATSSINAADNAGPFDNTFGTETTNILPTTAQAGVTDQFIGTYKGTMPTRQTEFIADTGFSIPNMTVGGTTYQQIVWWEYTALDYTTNNLATLRITGPSGTLWQVLRVCCPDGATCFIFVPSPFDMTASNISSSNACSDTSYVNTVYVSNDTFALGKTVYTNATLTTPFVGDGNYYGVNDTQKISIRIDSSGEIIETVTLCNP